MGVLMPSANGFGSSSEHFSLIMELHDAAVVAGIACYRDPRSGLSVMTAEFLNKRGYCCESGCRHCPYREPELH